MRSANQWALPWNPLRAVGATTRGDDGGSGRIAGYLSAAMRDLSIRIVWLSGRRVSPSVAAIHGARPNRSRYLDLAFRALDR